MQDKMEKDHCMSKLKVYELRLLRCSLATYPALPSSQDCVELGEWDAAINTVIAYIEKGEYAQALLSEPARQVFDCTGDREFENTKQGAEKFYRALEDRIAAFLRGDVQGIRPGESDTTSWLDFVESGDDTESQLRAMLAMALGVAALSAFVQCNMTGPCADFPKFPFCFSQKQENALSKEGAEWGIWSYQQLMSDGSDLLGKYVLPQYLILAKLLLLKTREITSKFKGSCMNGPKSISWWASRLLLVQQRILDERSRSLYELLQLSMEETLKHFGQSTNVIEYWVKLHGREVSVIVAAANLEAGIKEHLYGHVDRAR
eukprot:Gb_21130 [translate_table: standard]